MDIFTHTKRRVKLIRSRKVRGSKRDTNILPDKRNVLSRRCSLAVRGGSFPNLPSRLICQRRGTAGLESGISTEDRSLHFYF